MKSLARIKQEKAEREIKKLEKEKIKKEKEKEKKRLKRIARAKKKKSKANRKYYLAHKGAKVQERIQNGDELSNFYIYITKNRKRIDYIGNAKWRSNAYQLFNETIEKNKLEVKFPVQVKSYASNKKIPIKYEIILVKRTKDDEENVSKLRNDYGKFVENIIIDRENYVIIAKHEWLMEETFHVYGYHPIRNRKTYDFILNEIILKDINGKYDIRMIQTYCNKLFIRYNDDFDFVVCKTPEDAQRLYRKIERQIPKIYKKNIIFIGEIAKASRKHLVEQMINKTGWTKHLCTLSKP